MLPSVAIGRGETCRACSPGAGTRARNRSTISSAGRRPGDERVAVAGAHRVEDLLRDEADVEPVRHHQVVPRVGREAPVRLLYSVAGYVEGELHLVDGVPPHARHAEGGPAQHCRLRRPRERLDAGELELHRQVVAVLPDVGVHAGGVGGEQPVGVGVIARPLGFVEGSPEPHQPGAAVVVERLRTEDLRQPPLAPAAPHLHLPQPVLRHDVALCEEQVVVVPRVDVGHAPLVADHLDRLLQAGHREFPVDGGERAAGELVERRLRARAVRDATGGSRRQRDQRQPSDEVTESGTGIVGRPAAQLSHRGTSKFWRACSGASRRSEQPTDHTGVIDDAVVAHNSSSCRAARRRSSRAKRWINSSAVGGLLYSRHTRRSAASVSFAAGLRCSYPGCSLSSRPSRFGS